MAGKKKTKEEPTHGYCAVCKGPIPKGVTFTFTEMMFRVHSSPDDCLRVLRPSYVKAFMKVNPHFKSKHRYVPKPADYSALGGI